MNLELLKVCCTLACSVRKINSAAFQYSDFYCFKCFTFQFRGEMRSAEDRIWSKWFYLEEEQHFKQTFQGWSDTGSSCLALTTKKRLVKPTGAEQQRGAGDLGFSSWHSAFTTCREGAEHRAGQILCLCFINSVLVPTVSLQWVQALPFSSSLQQTCFQDLVVFSSSVIESVLSKLVERLLTLLYIALLEIQKITLNSVNIVVLGFFFPGGQQYLLCFCERKLKYSLGNHRLTR